MEDIFDVLIRNAINGRLDCFAAEDGEYRELDIRLDKAQEKYNALSLSENERKVVEEMTEAGIAMLSRYASLAYKMAVKDTVSLLKTMNVIGSNDDTDGHVDL